MSVSGLPSRIYKRVIACGARQNQLPPAYIAFLDGIPDNGSWGDEKAERLKPVYAAVAEYSNDDDEDDNDDNDDGCPV